MGDCFGFSIVTKGVVGVSFCKSASYCVNVLGEEV